MMALVQELKDEVKGMKEKMNRSELVTKQLLAEIVQETARATRAEQALERTTAAQADSIIDTTTFIASGVRHYFLIF